MAQFVLSITFCILHICRTAFSLILFNRSDFISTRLSPVDQACFFVLQTSTGNITSPGYPNRLPLLADCRWTIEIPNMRQIHLRFTFFNLPDQNSERQCDTAYVTYGTFADKDRQVSESGRLCGSRFPRNFTAYGSRAWVLFISHWLVVGKTEERLGALYGGFRLEYRAVFKTPAINGSNATLLALGVVLVPFFLAFPVYHCVRKMRDIALRERRDRQVNHFREMIHKNNKSSVDITTTRESTSRFKTMARVSTLKNRNAPKLSDVIPNGDKLTDINNNEVCLPSKISVSPKSKLQQTPERRPLSSMDSGNSTFDADMGNTTTEHITCMEVHTPDNSVFTYESIYEASSEPNRKCDHEMSNSRVPEESSASPIYVNARVSGTTGETGLLGDAKIRHVYQSVPISDNTSESDLLESENQNPLSATARVSETTSETALLEIASHNLKHRGSGRIMSSDSGEEPDISE